MYGVRALAKRFNVSQEQMKKWLSDGCVARLGDQYSLLGLVKYLDRINAEW